MLLLEHDLELMEALDRFLESAYVAEKWRILGPVERKLQREMAKSFRAQGKLFVERFGRLRRYFKESISIGDWLPIFNEVADDTSGQFVDPLREAVRRSLQIGGDQAVERSQFDLMFSLENPRAVAYVEQHGAALVTRINETTRSYIKTVIEQGADEGWSYDRMARAITQRYVEFAVGKPQQHIRSRAHLVAVTEVGQAYEHGSYIVAQDLQAGGLTIEKAWFTVGDDRVSDGCQANQDAGWILLDEVFPSGHLHATRFPGCRCTTLTRMRRDDRGASAPVAAPAPAGPASSPMGTAVSAALKLPKRGKLAQPLADAMAAIDATHGDGELPELPVKSFSSERTHGQYRYVTEGRSIKPLDIKISTKGDHYQTTFAHEVGHFLDLEALDLTGSLQRGNARAEYIAWENAVKESVAYKRFESLRRGEEKVIFQGEEYSADWRYVNYTMEPVELWARSYAQYVSSRGGSEAMRWEMSKQVEAAMLGYPTQWQEDDFGPIADAIDGIFRSKGWLE